MADRLDLQAMLEELLGSRNVYFQPPASVRMKYPAIKYRLGGIRNTHANNSVYAQSYSYELTLIDEDPDSEFVNKISRLPRCKFDRPYVADNLNHWVFTIFY